jgi:hypothetical protein
MRGHPGGDVEEGMRFFAGLCILALCLASSARVAAAESSVVVLGLRSLEGDDDFANAMTDALRGAAKGVTGWRLLERAVSMSQMTLAHNCDDIDAGCLSEIARGLDADRVVFGTVRRTAARSKYDYEITVSVFNGTTHSIAGTETQTVERADGKQKKALAKRAQSMVERLAVTDASAGRVAIEVNVLTVDVRMDGQLVGQTHDGKLSLDSVSPGEHTFEISAVGQQTQTRQVTVAPADQNVINVVLERVPEAEVSAAPEAVAPSDDSSAQRSHGSLNWLGYTLIGVGVASALAWGASMYVIEFQYNKDATYQARKNSYGEGTARGVDACDEALAGRPSSKLTAAADLSDFQGQCRTARTFQTLQWVFLGAAVVAGGVGAFVLISQSGETGPSEQATLKPPRLALQPQFERRSLGMQATLRF